MTADYSPSHGIRAEHTFYARAPIVEVILQLDFAGAPTSPNELAAFTVDLAQTYPTRDELRGFEAQIQFGPQGMQAVTTQQAPPSGYQLKDAKSHRLVRAFPTAISFHEIQPYQGWASFIGEAHQVFGVYLRRVPRTELSRIGLRYINRIDLPLDAGEIRSWVRSAPDIPEGLPQLVSSYSSEMAMPQPDLPGVTAVMRQALLIPDSPLSIPVVVDIEMVCQASVPVPALWSFVEWLHERENMIFERTITDRVRGIIS
jgi:uncharacterized protein (TIGR04255 family)